MFNRRGYLLLIRLVAMLDDGIVVTGVTLYQRFIAFQSKMRRRNEFEKLDFTVGANDVFFVSTLLTPRPPIR